MMQVEEKSWKISIFKFWSTNQKQMISKSAIVHN